MARSTVKDLTEGKPFRLVTGFALPLLFGVLFQQLYSFVDTAIVGRTLGADKLGAVGSTGSINFLILGFCMGICSGFAIPVAQSFGAKDYSEMRRFVIHAAKLCAVTGVTLGIATALLCPLILQWMNTPDEILDDAVSYIRIIFAAIPVTMLYNMTAGILRSLGDSRTPVLFLILAALLNVVLDLLFIIRFGMGVAGAAWATAVSQLCSGTGCLVFLMKRFPILKTEPAETKWDGRYAKRLMGIGVPMGLQFSITAIGSVILQTSVNGLGTTAVAAVTAGGKLSMFFTCIYDALSSTMATFAGQNVGAKKLDRIGEGLKAASVIGIAYSIFATVVLWLFGKQLVGLFVDAGDSEVIDMAYQYLQANSILYIPLLFVNIVRLTIQGMGFTRVAMIAGLFEMVARSFVALILVPVFKYTAACFANPAAWVAADLFLFPCYFSMMKRLRIRFGQYKFREE